VPKPLSHTPPPVGATAVAVSSVAADVCVRPLLTNEECQACVELQKHVWGFDQDEIVPSTLLHAVGYVGGLVAGAFDANDALLGFVFGITGVRGGELAHWSHMLGVQESARNLGVGRLLKEYQRSTLAALGVRSIYWSFDPLMAKNAYFNINRLNATVVEYIPDMYGRTASPLHLGLATDRLIVRLGSSEQGRSPMTFSVDRGVPILTPLPRRDDNALTVGRRTPPTVLLEIPADILDVLERTPAAAQTWRLAVRDNFHWALRRGYFVVGVHGNRNADRAFYVLSKRDDRG